MILVMPDGFSIDSSQLSSYAITAGATVTLTNIFGTIHSIIVNDPGGATTNNNAQALMSAIANAMNSATAEGETVYISPNGVVLESVSPITFTGAAANVVTLLINGQYFGPGILGGLFYICDVIGGMDDNDYIFVGQTIIDPQTLIAVWSSTPGASTGNCFLYYRNAAGISSNWVGNIIAT